MDNDTALKGCPFCGDKPKLTHENFSWGYSSGDIYVRSKCGVFIRRSILGDDYQHKTNAKLDAITAWNTRITEQPDDCTEAFEREFTELDHKKDGWGSYTSRETNEAFDIFMTAWNLSFAHHKSSKLESAHLQPSQQRGDWQKVEGLEADIEQLIRVGITNSVDFRGFVAANYPKEFKVMGEASELVATRTGNKTRLNTSLTDSSPAPIDDPKLVEAVATTLTLPQRKMLDQIRTYGERGYKPIEYNFKSKSRLCEKLVVMGLAYHYPHGGFSITEAGKNALAAPIATIKSYKPTNEEG